VENLLHELVDLIKNFRQRAENASWLFLVVNHKILQKEYEIKNNSSILN
jgi:hypothetical protein